MKKIVNRCKSVLNNRSGETIIEVVVAFALLSIMLVLFSQGIAWATNTEMAATDNRKKADDSMIKLQENLAAENASGGSVVVTEDGTPIITENGVALRRFTYPAENGEGYYVVYEVV